MRSILLSAAAAASILGTLAFASVIPAKDAPAGAPLAILAGSLVLPGLLTVGALQDR